MASTFWQKRSSKLTDTHCHLMDGYGEQTLRNIHESGMCIHNMSTTPQQYLEALEVFPKERYPNINHALGFFPLMLKDHPDQKELFFKHLPLAKFVGEIGLDGSEDGHEFEDQRAFFKDVVSASNDIGGQVLSIHSRRAAEDVLNICKQPFEGIQILHWYSGPLDIFEHRLPPHLFFSINTAMLKSRHGRALIQSCPMDKVCLETDGPYIKVGNRAAAPSDLIQVLSTLAQRWDMDLEQAFDIVSTPLEQRKD